MPNPEDAFRELDTEFSKQNTGPDQNINQNKNKNPEKNESADVDSKTETPASTVEVRGAIDFFAKDIADTYQKYGKQFDQLSQDAYLKKVEGFLTEQKKLSSEKISFVLQALKDGFAKQESANSVAQSPSKPNTSITSEQTSIAPTTAETSAPTIDLGYQTEYGKMQADLTSNQFETKTLNGKTFLVGADFVAIEAKNPADQFAQADLRGFLAIQVAQGNPQKFSQGVVLNNSALRFFSVNGKTYITMPNIPKQVG